MSPRSTAEFCTQHSYFPEGTGRPGQLQLLFSDREKAALHLVPNFTVKGVRSINLLGLRGTAPHTDRV